MAFDDPNKTFIARVIKTANSGQRVEINGYTPNGIAFFTGHEDETFPGTIIPSASGNTLRTVFRSPGTAADSFNVAELSLEMLTDETTIVNLQADNARLIGGNFVHVISNEIKLGDSTPGGDLIVENHPVDAKGLIRNEDETWHGTADTPLTGTWVDVAGSRFGYYKDATGRVQVRGRVAGGGAGAVVVTLPVGYRPTSNLEFTMRSGVNISAVTVGTGGVLTVSANLASASANGINLDVISFPTF